jgi:hypothetical protein
MTTIDKHELARQIAAVHTSINNEFWGQQASKGLMLQGVQRLAVVLAEKLDEPENEVITGMGLIGQMSRDELIRELIHYQLEQLNELNQNKLKLLVVQMRSHRYQHRLVEEAQLEEQGPMGFLFGQGSS